MRARGEVWREEDEDGHTTVIVNGIAGSQVFMSEKQFARYDPDEILTIAEASNGNFAELVGLKLALSPVQIAAGQLQRRVHADMARREAARTQRVDAAKKPRPQLRHPSYDRAI